MSELKQIEHVYVDLTAHVRGPVVSLIIGVDAQIERFGGTDLAIFRLSGTWVAAEYIEDDGHYIVRRMADTLQELRDELHGYFG